MKRFFNRASKQTDEGPVDDVSEQDMLDLASVDEDRYEEFSPRDHQNFGPARSSRSFLDNDEFVPPSLEEAKQYRDDHQPWGYIDGERVPLLLTSTDAEIGAEFGVGIALYFVFMRWMTALWFLMYVLSVPTLCFANFGTFEGIYTESMNRTGISTFQVDISATTFAAISNSVDADYLRMGVPETWYIQTKDLLTGSCALDVLASLLFLIGGWLMQRRMRKYVNDIDADTIEISDYTIEVKGLPKDCSDSLEVQCFFEIKYGKVVDVILCRNDTKLLNLYKQKTKVLHDLMRENQRCLKNHRGETPLLKSLTKKLDRLEKKVSQYQTKSYFETVAAFVTFSEISSALKCLQDCPTSRLSRWLLPEEKRFRGTYKYICRTAPQPSVIVYENIGYGMKSRMLRTLASATFTFMCLAISFAAIRLCRDLEQDTIQDTSFSYAQFDSSLGVVMPQGPTMSSTEANTFRLEEYQATCDPVLMQCSESLSTMGSFAVLKYGSWADVLEVSVEGIAVGTVMEPGDLVRLMKNKYSSPSANATLAAPGSNVDSIACLPCYCAGLATQLSSKEKEDNYNLLQDQCDEFVTYNLDYFIWRGVSVGAILIINKVLEVVLVNTSQFEKHQILSEQQQSTAFKVYLATTLNTALLTLLINADLRTARKMMDSIKVFQGWVFNGAYPDFNDLWYENIGVSMIGALACFNFAPPFNSWAMHLSTTFFRWSGRQTALTQQELNEAYLGPEFQLDLRFGQLMMVMTVTMMFGSGMPILYLMAGIGFALEARYDRRHLLGLCRKPPRYGKEMVYGTVRMMPWLAAIHAAVGVWMHSHFETERVDKYVDQACEVTNTCAFFGSNSTMFSDFTTSIASKTGIDLSDLDSQAAMDAASNSTQMVQDNGDDGNLDLYGRSMQINSFPLLVLLLLVLFFLVVWRYLFKGILLRLGSSVFFCFGKVEHSDMIKKVRANLGGPSFEDAYLEDKIRGLTSYSLKENPKYKDAFFKEEVAQVTEDEPDIDMEDMRRMLIEISGEKAQDYNANPEQNGVGRAASSLRNKSGKTTIMPSPSMVKSSAPGALKSNTLKSNTLKSSMKVKPSFSHYDKK